MIDSVTQSGSPFSASNTSWITSITKIVCAIASFYVLHRFDRFNSEDESPEIKYSVSDECCSSVPVSSSSLPSPPCPCSH